MENYSYRSYDALQWSRLQDTPQVRPVPPRKDQPYLGIVVANTGAQVMHDTWVMGSPFAKMKLAEK
jgi:hypothetical protein